MYVHTVCSYAQSQPLYVFAYASYPSQVCEMKNCNKCIYFQMRKKQDLYMW